MQIPLQSPHLHASFTHYAHVCILRNIAKLEHKQCWCQLRWYVRGWVCIKRIQASAEDDSPSLAVKHVAKENTFTSVYLCMCGMCTPAAWPIFKFLSRPNQSMWVAFCHRSPLIVIRRPRINFRIIPRTSPHPSRHEKYNRTNVWIKKDEIPYEISTLKYFALLFPNSGFIFLFSVSLPLGSLYIVNDVCAPSTCADPKKKKKNTRKKVVAIL